MSAWVTVNYDWRLIRLIIRYLSVDWLSASVYDCNVTSMLIDCYNNGPSFVLTIRR